MGKILLCHCESGERGVTLYYYKIQTHALQYKGLKRLGGDMNQQILMNFSMAPTEDDISVIATNQLETMPDELIEHVEKLTIQIEDMPDETTESDLELDDPYELLVLYKAGKELTPGVETKVANDDDVLILYRRSILDAWCETGEDLTQIVRESMIEEIGNHFEFSDDDIESMNSQHYQGML